ncbi:ParB/RepB/Spo0J family partition protein [Comamonas serinivorans]|uniref:ParB/RepB/Spo0J family partition protein n=1 Tax=Comamonas serinivorans TaxID=1082851 RepID=UPI00196B73A2|nr:hypothetical protein [Comamonas serinivorans]
MNTYRKMIADKVIKRSDVGQQIRLQDIHVKPGFNKRAHTAAYEAAQVELVEYLAGGGTVPALEVYPRDEGGVWLVEGHRRHDAFTRLAAAGQPVEWILITPFNGNDAERVARIATSNSQLQLAPIERAAVYAQLRAFNWSVEDIAKRVGKTAEHVRSLLQLCDADTDVQELVKAGEVSATVAVQHVRKHGERAGEVLEQKLTQAKAEGKAKVTGSADAPDFAKALQHPALAGMPGLDKLTPQALAELWAKLPAGLPKGALFVGAVALAQDETH